MLHRGGLKKLLSRVVFKSLSHAVMCRHGHHVINCSAAAGRFHCLHVRSDAFKSRLVPTDS